MSASPFGGLWTYPSHSGIPGRFDFVFIDESRGRLVQFNLLDPGSGSPCLMKPMRLWYRPQSATSIVTRLSREDPWREFVFALDGDTMSWTFAGIVSTWRRVSLEARPAWLDAQLAVAHSKMDAQEETEDPRID